MKKIVCAQMKGEDLARIEEIGRVMMVEDNTSVVIRAAIRMLYNHLLSDEQKKEARKRHPDYELML